MSSGATGSVVAAPVIMAAAGAAAIGVAAVAVATVAVVGIATAAVVRVGATATIAVGQELVAMARQGVYIRREIEVAAREYEQTLAALERQGRAVVAQEAAARVKAWQCALVEQENALRRWRQAQVLRAAQDIDFAALDALEGPVDAASVSVPQRQVLPVPRPSAEVEQLQGYTNAVEQAFNRFLEQGGGELFDCTYLQGLLNRSKSALHECYTQALAGRLDVTQLLEAQSDIIYVRRRLEEMNAGVANVQVQRQTALDALADTQAKLAQVAGRVDLTIPGIRAGLDLADDTYQNAQLAFEQRRFEKARALAESAMVNLAQTHENVADVRRQNLDTIVRMYENALVPLANLEQGDLATETGYSDKLVAGLLDASGQATQWLEELRQVRAQAAAGDVEGAWAMLGREGEGLRIKIETTVEGAVDQLKRCGVESTAGCARQTLLEMGYQIEGERWVENGYQVTGQQGTRRFHLAILEDGRLGIDLKGYGDDSCHYETERFFEGLEAKGVRGLWQRRFHASEAAKVMASVLHQRGYDVTLEPRPEGVGLVAYRGAERQDLAVDWDHRPYGPEAWTRVYLDRWVSEKTGRQRQESAYQRQSNAEWATLMERYAREQQERENRRVRVLAG